MDRVQRNTAFLIYISAAALIGAGHLITSATLPLVYALPILIRRTTNPVQAAVIACAYILASSYGLFFGVALLSDVFTALIAWLALAVLLSLPWLLSHLRYCGIVIAVVLMSMPPLGFLTQVSPLIAAGYLFPGLGFLGAFLSAIVFQSLYLLPARNSVSIVALMLALSILFSVPTVATTVSSTPMFKARNLDAGRKVTIGDCCDADHQAHEILLDSLIAHSANDIQTPIYPEAAGGVLTISTKQKLAQISRATNQAFFIGGETQVNNQYDNVLLYVTPDGRTQIKYRQRVPAPWFMWRGQDAPGFFRADLARPATFIHKSQTIGALICYEISAPWLILSTHFHAPDQIIVISNLWWGRATNLPQIMQLKARSWSRLFGVPYILSLNK